MKVSRIGTVNKSVVATSRQSIPWHHINWRKANRSVRRLQHRIVKAQQAGDHRKVRALQHLLTRSFSASALAVKKVTENKGKRTPGVDQVLWRTNRQKSNAIQEVRRGQYKAKPLRRIYIPKQDGSQRNRPLSIPCMIDRAKQALYLMALDPLAEYYADKNSYGFRKYRSAMDAITACRMALQRNHSAHWVLKADIKACFDQINHAWLLKWIPMDKSILAQWLKAGYVEKRIWRECKAGTPQGGIISPTLMNLTLDGLELQLKQQFKKVKVNVIRYADDFIVTGNSKALLEDKVKPQVEAFLNRRGLMLSETKTQIIPITEGFNFLGFHIKRFKSGLIVEPSKQSVKNVKRNIKQTFKRNMQAETVVLIRKLTPITRGWGNYYRHTSGSKKVFSNIDHYTWQCSWSWAKRRHPNKGKKWVKKKYYRRTSRTKWGFHGTLPNKERIRLPYLFEIKRTLHIKIRHGKNPYDAEHAEYFEARRKKKDARGMIPKLMNHRLWEKQRGICPLCGDIIDNQTGYHCHHVIHRCDMGENHIDNLVLLHPTCHEQWHLRDNECCAGLSKKVFEKARAGCGKSRTHRS